MSKKKWEKSSPELVLRFEKALGWFPQLERKQMFGYPCGFLNGNLTTGLHEQNWIARLEEPDRSDLESQHNAIPFEVNGRSMREYRVLPKSIVDDDRQLKEWLGKSVQFVGGLPPKKKKAARKKTAN